MKPNTPYEQQRVVERITIGFLETVHFLLLFVIVVYFNLIKTYKNSIIYILCTSR